MALRGSPGLRGIAGLETAIALIAFAGRPGSPDVVYRLILVVSNSLAGEPVDLTPPYSADEPGLDPDFALLCD